MIRAENNKNEEQNSWAFDRIFGPYSREFDEAFPKMSNSGVFRKGGGKHDCIHIRFLKLPKSYSVTRR